MQLLQKLIKDQIMSQFDLDVFVPITRPEPEFGDYATPVAMQLAKILGQNPVEIANQIKSSLEPNLDIESVSVAGPGFINISIKPASLKKYFDVIWTDNFGSSDSGAGKTVVVDFPSPNMAKPYSVGHLRPGNQGWAIKRLMEQTGWKVITDNHLGDYGSPFGIWVCGFLHFSSDEALNRDGIYELGRVYIEMKSALKKEKENGESILADEVQSWLLKLENSDEQALEYSKRFNEISLEHIHKVMARLNIRTDYELGEAFFAPKAKQAIDNLVKDNVATTNEDGSVIVDLSDQGIDVPILLKKSNGALLYASTDLATLVYRQENWQPDRVIYCVGQEQQFYFSQLFALAKKIGLSTELIHLWFGVIDQIGPGGVREKMSSRKGVVLMEELLDQAEAKAREITEGRSIGDEDIKTIALGAIKFSDFASDRRTNILFEWKSIFALSGYSGPYVQYAGVRLKKIIDNIKNDSNNIDGEYDYKAEKALIIKLLDYPDTVELSARDLEPHKVAKYVYDLAREVNRYYETTRVMESGPVEKAARLDVLNKVYNVIKVGLDILGIQLPSEM